MKEGQHSSVYVCYSVTYQVQLTCPDIIVLTAQPTLVFTVTTVRMLNTQTGDGVSKALASIQASKFIAMLRGNLIALDPV